MRTLRSLSAVIAVSTLAAAAAACGGASSKPVAPVARAPEVRGCGRALDASRSPGPLGLTRSGSTVALAKLGDKTLAYIADEDDSAVHVVDVDTQKDISKTPVAGKPGAVMFLAECCRDGLPPFGQQKDAVDGFREWLAAWGKRFGPFTRQRATAENWASPSDDDFRKQLSSARAKIRQAGLGPFEPFLLPHRGAFGIRVLVSR